MSAEDTRRQLDERRAQLASVRREREKLSEVEQALEQVVQGLHVLLKAEGGHVPTRNSITVEPVTAGIAVGPELVDPVPRGREAVRALLREGGAMEFTAIIDEIKSRGWIKSDAKNPDHSIRVTVDRMSKDAEIVYDEQGRVALAQSPLPNSGGQI